MWILFNLIFLAIAFCVAVLATWGVWSFFALCLADRKKRAVLLGLPVSLALVFLAIPAVWFYDTRPGTVFQREFGFPLPPNTTIINSTSFALGDSGSAYIHLRTSPTTLARITAKYHRGPAECSSNDKPPSWFNPPTTPNIWSFAQSGPLTTAPANFHSEFRTLTYDPSTGDAWYSYLGVD